MKHIISFVISVLAFALMPFGVVFAEGAQTIEIDSSGTVLPVPELDGNGYYEIAVFEKKDTDFTNPLCENELVYSFEKTGEYVVRWTIYQAGAISKPTVNYVEITIADTTAPQIELEENWRGNYKGVTELKVINASCTDNSGTVASFGVQVFCGKDQIEIKDGVFAVSSGAYKVVYTASDNDGNTATLEYSFTVISSDSESNSVTNESMSNVGIIVAIILVIVVIATAFIVFFVVKNKKRTNQTQNVESVTEEEKQ